MRLQAVVGSGFDGDADALGSTLLAELDGLHHTRGVVARERVMQIADEEVLVNFGTCKIQTTKPKKQYSILHCCSYMPPKPFIDMKVKSMYVICG